MLHFRGKMASSFLSVCHLIIILRVLLLLLPCVMHKKNDFITLKSKKSFTSVSLKLKGHPLLNTLLCNIIDFSSY